MSRLEYWGPWLSLQAHSSAVWHWLRGHKVHFIGDLELWCGCWGDVWCEECPDTAIEDGKHVGLSIWCRHSWAIAWLGMKLCGLLGHPVFQHPKRYDAYVEDEIYCYRCMFDSKLRKAWANDNETDKGGPLEGAGSSTGGPELAH
jgi:hypothetical protein